MKLSIISSAVIKSILIVPVLFLFGGCANESKADLVEFVESTFKNNKPDIEPLPPVEPYEEFIYIDEGLIDPFDISNVRVGESSDENEEVSSRRREPLEAYSLESIQMDGIIEFGGKLSALVRTPDGVFSVKVGNYIGLNEGEVVSINSEEHVVEIRERVRNAIGLWEFRSAKLQGNDPLQKVISL